MLTIKDMFDMRDTKFTVGPIYPPEKQKFLEDKLRESAARVLEPLENPFGPKVLPMCPERSVTYVSGPDLVFDGYKCSWCGCRFPFCYIWASARRRLLLDVSVFCHGHDATPLRMILLALAHFKIAAHRAE